MFQRTAGRFDGGEMDPPVEASINEIINNPMTALFGVGQGGSSFVAMKFIGEAFDYALAPNITFVLLLVEAGMVGTMLFLGVFGMQVVRVGTSVIVKDDSEIRTLFVIGLSAMLLNLAGSGIPLGIPLAVACMAVAAHKVRLAARTNIPEGSMNVWFHQ